MFLLVQIKQGRKEIDFKSRSNFEEFDPGSERTLVACLMHASRARRGNPAERRTGE